MTTTPTAAAADGSIPYRRMILEIMQAKPERRFSYPALLALIRGNVPDVDTKDAQAALTWNFKKGNVNFEHDHELEIDVWALTSRGLNA